MSEEETRRLEVISFIREWAASHDWSSEAAVAAAKRGAGSVFEEFKVENVLLDQPGGSIWKFVIAGRMNASLFDDDLSEGDYLWISAEGALIYNALSEEYEIINFENVKAYMTNERAEKEQFSDDLSGLSETMKELSGVKWSSIIHTPSLIPETGIDSADKMLAYISTLSKNSWYRGHADEKWKLLTGIARQKNPNPTLENKLRLAFENQTDFLNTSSHKYGAAEYTFMMQHHGLPTRLLDWTTSPLTALYFAVCNDNKDSNDACIWMMDPAQLNRLHSKSFPYELSGDENQSSMFLQKKEEKALAIHAPYTNLRMKAQQAEFTLHSSYEPLEKMKGAEVYLREKIIIPKAFKPELRSRLTVLGVTRAALFPDYDNIAKTIRDDMLDSVPADSGEGGEDRVEPVGNHTAGDEQ